MKPDSEQDNQVVVEVNGPICTILLNRPDKRNAVDRPTAYKLAQALRKFEASEDQKVGILCGMGSSFCAGADLSALTESLNDPVEMLHEFSPLKRESEPRYNRIHPDGDGPMGPTRMLLKKPIIAAISGFAVAGGLELACWCDLRIATEEAQFGVYCRRWGVPLIDGGTYRLPHIIGLGRAMDMILTARTVTANEAFQWGLVNRIVRVPEDKKTETHQILRQEAEKLALQISSFPQFCLIQDRISTYQNLGRTIEDGLRNEFSNGVQVVLSGQPAQGAQNFLQEGKRSSASSKPTSKL